MEEHIQFLRTLVEELRNQRDEWREQSIERGMEIMRLRARNQWLSEMLDRADEAALS